MRRRLVLTIVGIIGLLGLVIGIGAASVSRKEYLGFIEESLKNEAAARGVRLATRNLDIFPFGMRASELDVYFVRYLFALTIGEATARINDLTPTVTFSGEAYGGTIGGTFARPWFSREISGAGAVATVSLAKHPQLSALGVSGGSFDLTIHDAAFDTDSRHIQRARFEGKITGFTRATPLILRPGQFGSPFALTIPPIPPTDIEATGSIEGGRIAVSRALVTTTLGQLSATGEIPFAASSEVAIDALLSLSAEGAATVGPYLPLVSAGAVDPQAKKVRLVVRGPRKAPQLKWSRAG